LFGFLPNEYISRLFQIFKKDGTFIQDGNGEGNEACSSNVLDSYDEAG
jgi:hypothetical protein